MKKGSISSGFLHVKTKSPDTPLFAEIISLFPPIWPCMFLHIFSHFCPTFNFPPIFAQSLNPYAENILLFSIGYLYLCMHMFVIFHYSWYIISLMLEANLFFIDLFTCPLLFSFASFSTYLLWYGVFISDRISARKNMYFF